jgi:hypothetical protein
MRLSEEQLLLVLFAVNRDLQRLNGLVLEMAKLPIKSKQWGTIINQRDELYIAYLDLNKELEVLQGILN